MDLLAELAGVVIEAVVGTVVGKMPSWLYWAFLGLVLFIVLAVFA